MAGIVRPKQSYAARRSEFAERRGLPKVIEDPAIQARETTDEDTVVPELPTEPPEEPRGAAPQPVHRPRRSTPAASVSEPATGHAARTAGAGKVVRFYVPAPKPGTYAFFDKASAAMGAERALRRILAKALQDLEAVVDAGVSIEPASYPLGTLRFHTSRNLSPAMYLAARSAFDPLDIETPAEIGRSLAMAAVARYLSAAQESSDRGAGA